MPHVSVLFQAREQDVSRIIQALSECLAALPRQQLRRVRGVGVSGQMHGVLFWKTGHGMLGPGVITRCEVCPVERAVWRVSGGEAGAHAASYFASVLTRTDVLVNVNNPFIHSTSSAQ